MIVTFLLPVFLRNCLSRSQFSTKSCLRKAQGETLWQPGPDRNFQAWETKNIITVSEEWGNAEAQKISEEQVIEEIEELIQDSPEDPKKEHAPTMNNHVGDLGSEENASAEDSNGAYLKENPSSSAVKNGRSSHRKAKSKEVPLSNGIETQAKIDKNSAELEDEENLVTENEGPVLVPGLTLLVSSEEEALAKEN